MVISILTWCIRLHRNSRISKVLNGDYWLSSCFLYPVDSIEFCLFLFFIHMIFHHLRGIFLSCHTASRFFFNAKSNLITVKLYCIWDIANILKISWRQNSTYWLLGTKVLFSDEVLEYLPVSLNLLTAFWIALEMFLRLDSVFLLALSFTLGVSGW